MSLLVDRSEEGKIEDRSEDEETNRDPLLEVSKEGRSHMIQGLVPKGHG